MSQLTDEEKKYIKGFNFDKLEHGKKESILLIIESSLETLYEYSEIFLDMLKDEESKIKIFKVQSKFNSEKWYKKKVYERKIHIRKFRKYSR